MTSSYPATTESPILGQALWNTAFAFATPPTRDSCTGKLQSIVSESSSLPIPIVKKQESEISVILSRTRSSFTRNSSFGSDIFDARRSSQSSSASISSSDSSTPIESTGNSSASFSPTRTTFSVHTDFYPSDYSVSENSSYKSSFSTHYSSARSSLDLSNYAPSASEKLTRRSSLILVPGQVIDTGVNLTRNRAYNRVGSLSSPSKSFSSQASSTTPSAVGKANFAWGAQASPPSQRNSISPSPTIAFPLSTSNSPITKQYHLSNPSSSPFGKHYLASQSAVELSSSLQVKFDKYRFADSRNSTMSHPAINEERSQSINGLFSGPDLFSSSAPNALQAPAEIGLQTPRPFAPTTPPREALPPTSTPPIAPNPESEFTGRFTNTSAGLPSPARAGFRFANATPISTPLGTMSSPRAPVSLKTARTLDFDSSSSRMGMSPRAVGLMPSFESSEDSPPPRRSNVNGSGGISSGDVRNKRNSNIEFSTWGTPGSMRPIVGSPSLVDDFPVAAPREKLESVEVVPLRSSTPPTQPIVNLKPQPVEMAPWSPVLPTATTQVIAIGEGLGGGPQRDEKGRKINKKKWMQDDPLNEGFPGAGAAVEEGDGKKGGNYKKRWSRSVVDFFSDKSGTTVPVKETTPVTAPAPKRFSTQLKSLSLVNLLSTSGKNKEGQGDSPVTPTSSDGNAVAALDSGARSSPPPDVPERSSSHRNSAYLRRRARLSPAAENNKSKLSHSPSLPALREQSEYQRGAAEKVQTWLTSAPTNGRRTSASSNAGLGFSTDSSQDGATLVGSPVMPSESEVPRKQSPLVKRFPGLFRKSKSFSGSEQQNLSDRQGQQRPAHSRAASSSSSFNSDSSKGSFLYRLRNASTTSLARLSGSNKKEEIPHYARTSASRPTSSLGWNSNRQEQNEAEDEEVAGAAEIEGQPTRKSSGDTTSSTHSPMPIVDEGEEENGDLMPPSGTRFLEVNLQSGLFSVEELMSELNQGPGGSPTETEVDLRRRSDIQRDPVGRSSFDTAGTEQTTMSYISGTTGDIHEAAIGHVVSAPFLPKDPSSPIRLAFPAPPARATSPIPSGARTPTLDGSVTPKMMTGRRLEFGSD